MMPRDTPRKYRIANSQKLRELVNLKLGASTSGREWCIKALHPSDPLTDVRGIPDQSAQPTTVVNWQMESTVKCSATSGTWSCDITALPDPVSFGCYSKTESASGATTLGSFLNTQLSATNTYPACRLALTQAAERWRLAYYGLTVYCDAPSLADQGTVAAASVPVEPSLYSFVGLANTTPSSTQVAVQKAIVFQTTDVPAFETLVRMPNAYTGQAKNGVYFPMKLSTNHMRWHSTADFVNDATGWLSATKDYSMTVKTGTSDPMATSGWPYYGETSAWVNTTTGVVETRTRCMPANENFGAICFQNLSYQASLTLVWRVGFEIQAGPQSTLSSYLHLSPAYDRIAVDDYYAISRELKDAYPADYNDLGKLWEVIKKAARAALPVVRNFGPIGAGVGMIGDALLGPPPDTSTPEPRDKLPAATVERVQAATEAAPYVAAARRKIVAKRRPAVRMPKYPGRK